jgi:hypothetical protein
MKTYDGASTAILLWCVWTALMILLPKPDCDMPEHAWNTCKVNKLLEKNGSTLPIVQHYGDGPLWMGAEIKFGHDVNDDGKCDIVVTYEPNKDNVLRAVEVKPCRNE